jgi:hypothetical protein
MKKIALMLLLLVLTSGLVGCFWWYYDGDHGGGHGGGHGGSHYGRGR